MTVYLSIGNSDDKLTQKEWAQFVTRIRADVISTASQVHGAWFSGADSMWQNACWCLEFSTEPEMKAARETVRAIRRQYRQESAAWAVAETEFI